MVGWSVESERGGEACFGERERMNPLVFFPRKSLRNIRQYIQWCKSGDERSIIDYSARFIFPSFISRKNSPKHIFHTLFYAVDRSRRKSLFHTFAQASLQTSRMQQRQQQRRRSRGSRDLRVWMERIISSPFPPPFFVSTLPKEKEEKK